MTTTAAPSSPLAEPSQSRSAPSTEQVTSVVDDTHDAPIEQQQQLDPTPSDQSRVAPPPPHIVVIRDGRYCHVTGCVLVPIVVDGVRVMTNWVMSSTDNIIAPDASARIVDNAQATANALAEASHAPGQDADQPDTSPTQDCNFASASTASPSPPSPPSSTPSPSSTPTAPLSSYLSHTDNGTAGTDARRAWPTVCHALGTVHQARVIGVGSARIQMRDEAPDMGGIPFLRAHSVRVSSLSCVQLAHRVAQAHSSIVSVARPALRGSHTILGRLVADGAVSRPSVLWDMRARTQRVTVAVGVAAPVNDPDAALVRLYRPDHPDVIAAGESVVTLARTTALARVLGIEVAVSPETPTMRLPLDAPEWAVIDVGVRACYFDQEVRRTVVEALARSGPPSWRASPLWSRGTVLTHEADGVTGLARQQAPVLALVLAGHDPARPVRLRMGHDAYVHTTPLHQVCYRWPDPDDRPAGRDNAAGGGGDNGDIIVQLQYTQIDLASWMNRSPGGTCLVGNCAFQGRAVLVDYEADVMAVFSGATA
ncbi:hypothetical protein pkur_cds_220 [Pandoravirus kuranda]|uniref:Uncharacterized protein n=1 Tax=Pandoravirus kuranda TaxID=3019033 RepID=A0AA95EEE4_9VIRU|nr:hypothetical protein pkur_cds_220 [Pandoravirus kuranda]